MIINKPPEPSEFQIQCNVFKWAEIMAVVWPELKLLKASMNGLWIPNTDPSIKKSVIKRFKWKIIALLKKCGCLRSGWPDIQLPIPRCGYHGLFIELKRAKGGKVSEAQSWFLKELSKHGNYTCVCEGEKATKRIILSYLKGELKNK